MSSITKQRNGRYIYIYESKSYWDTKRKYPNNNKKCIGKIDPDTGGEYYKQEYIERQKIEGKTTDSMKVWHDKRKRPMEIGTGTGVDLINIAQEILSTVKSIGLAYFLQSVAEKIGLVRILKQTMPNQWQRLFVLACYLVAENKSVMHCSDWVEENECADVGNMASQRINELLSSFGYKERNEFFRQWYQQIRENEYIALDITSVSSYSGNISFLEIGYNRDDEKLPQINICLLFGEKSMMPIYQTIYNGSLTDVTTLETTLSEFEAITGAQDIMVVTDKGFFRAENINRMLESKKTINNKKQASYKFLVPVSFTTNFAKDHVKNEQATIDDVDNVILTDDEMPIRGVYKYSTWKDDIKLHTHIYYDPEKALRKRNDLYSYVAKLKMLAVDDPENTKHQKEFQKYLCIEKANTSNGSVTVEIRKDVIEKSLKHSGWFVLISNRIDNIHEALDIYRAKDVVEKSFFQYKNNLGLFRLRVHNDERTLNKTFVAFIALILSSYIHKGMKNTGLDKEFTFEKLLSVLSKLKIAYINNTPVLQPLTKQQKQIFKAFEVEPPDCSGLNSHET